MNNGNRKDNVIKLFVIMTFILITLAIIVIAGLVNKSENIYFDSPPEPQYYANTYNYITEIALEV